MSDHANVSEVIMLGQWSPKVETMPPQQRLGELSRRQSGERACCSDIGSAAQVAL
jgi:hypothetical protein